MGKQSARLYYQGKDHKDIYFRGQFHEKMYIGKKLVWEKLYPEKYFVCPVGKTNGIFIPNKTVILAPGFAEIRMQNPLNKYSIQYLQYSQNYVATDIRQQNTIKSAITKDFIAFKLTERVVVNGIVGENFISNGGVVSINDSMEITVKKIQYPENKKITHPLTMCIKMGNYAVEAEEKEGGKYTYYIIDKNANAIRKIDDVVNVTDRELFDKRAMYDSVFSVILDDYIYYSVDPVTATEIPYKGRIVKRNLSTFEIKEVFDSGYRKIIWNRGCAYKSFEEVIAIFCLASTAGTLESVCFAKMHKNRETEVSKMDELSVNIYGTDEKIKIIPFGSKEDIEKGNALYFFRDDGKIGNIEFYNYEFPTINNGEIDSGSLKAMCFYTNIKFPQIGLVYIDNLNFKESENNYLYLVDDV